ncbi:MAG TPA: hypothetical protein VLF64_01150 [Candidatus Saccharimonadales bacterium]|nr:hypothetical protein [Candidatus Saccharimonadales bacterium]
MKLRLLVIVAMLVGLFAINVVGAPVSSAAVDIFGGCKDGVDCSSVQSKQTLNTQIWNFIRTALTILGGIAVVVIIAGGIMYTTSAGDPSKVTAAKNTILYSVVGLGVAMSAAAIITLVNNYFG